MGIIVNRLPESEVIRSITIEESGKTISVGDRLKLSGRYGGPAGTIVEVVSLRKPYTGGFTTDIIEARLPDDKIDFFKPKDIEWS